MKKSVILVIGIIYIAAIITVGFIGIALKVYDEKKYVESIECKSDNYIEETDPDLKTKWDGYIEIKYNKDAENLVIIKCLANPSDATNKKLKLFGVEDKGYDLDNPPEDLTGKEFGYRDNGDGTWTIKLIKNTSQIITVVSTDRNPSAKIRIQIKVKKSGSGIVPTE